MKQFLFELRVSGARIKVYEEDSILWGNRDGLYLGYTHHIVLRADAHPDIKRNALLHETLHAADAAIGAELNCERADKVATISMSILTGSSEGARTWLGGHCGELPDESTVNVMGDDLKASEVESDLWDDDANWIGDLSTGEIHVRSDRTEPDRRRALIEACLTLGLTRLGEDLDDYRLMHWAGAVLSVASNKEAMEWMMLR